MYLTCSLHVRVICTMSCCTLLVQVTYTSHYTLLFEHLCTLYILQWKYMQCGILWNYMYYAKYARCIPLPTLYQAVQCYNVNTTCKHLFIMCVYLLLCINVYYTCTFTVIHKTYLNCTIYHVRYLLQYISFFLKLVKSWMYITEQICFAVPCSTQLI